MRIVTKESQKASTNIQKRLKPMRIASNGQASIESLLLFTRVLSTFTCVLLAFAWVFKWYRLKPMQMLFDPYSHSLKPMLFAM